MPLNTLTLNNMKKANYYTRPVFKQEAMAFTEQHHRHSPPLAWHKFSIGVCKGNIGSSSTFTKPDGTIIKRPFRLNKSQHDPLLGLVSLDRCSSSWSRYDDYIEIRRLVINTDFPGLTKNLCSFLYAKAIQACKAMGYSKVVTYTRKYEPGTSLKATGFQICPLTEFQPTKDVNRWIIEL